MKLRKTWIFFFTLAMSAAGSPAQIVNGGFESPDGIDLYRVFNERNALPGWVVEQGTVEIHGRIWVAAEGSQSLDLNGIFEQIGTVYQDVPTQLGQRYRIRFAFAGNPAGGPTLKSFKVSWEGRELGTLSFDTTGLSFTNMNWRHHEFEVVASGSFGRLRFQSLTSSFCGPVIDDVSVTLVGAVNGSRSDEATLSRSVKPSLTAKEFSAAAITAAPVSAATNATLQVQLCAALTIFGSVGHAYRIECTDSFESGAWRTLTNLTLISNPHVWVDAEGVSGSRRFYRAVLTGE